MITEQLQALMVRAKKEAIQNKVTIAVVSHVGENGLEYNYAPFVAMNSLFSNHRIVTTFDNKGKQTKINVNALINEKGNYNE
jgi:hypothetical protein